MVTVSLTELEGDLLSFVRRVEAGESIVIADGSRYIAEMKPIASGQTAPRPFGLCAGEFEVPDDFDEALPDDLLREFES